MPPRVTHVNPFIALTTCLALASIAFATPTVEYTTGHTDVAVRDDGTGGVELFFLLDANAVLNGAQPGDEVESPNVTFIRIGDAQEAPRPSDTVWDFLDVPAGETVWFLPQASDPAAPWLGVSAEPLSSLSYDALTYTIEAVDGPGEPAFAIWQTDLAGDPFPVVSTADGLPDAFNVPIGSHSHYNWAFGEPGVYQVTLRADATRSNGDVLSDSATLWFAVGDGTTIEPTCAGDVTGDGAVDGGDLVALLGNFGGSGDRSQGDLDGNGDVDGQDLIALLGNFGTSCG